MNTVIIPIHTEPDRCPSCKHLEDIKTTCNHCGYEYIEDNEELSAKDTILIILCLVGCAILVMLLITIIGVWYTTDNTLLEACAEVLSGLIEPFSRII